MIINYNNKTWLHEKNISISVQKAQLEGLHWGGRASAAFKMRTDIVVQ